MSKKIVRRALHELLKNLASGKVYASRAPDDAVAPYIILQRESSERWRSLNGPSGIAQATIQIDVYADTAYGAEGLAGDVETILDGYRGLVYYGANSPQDSIRIGGISLQSDADLFDQTEKPFLHRVTGFYLVTYDQ